MASTELAAYLAIALPYQWEPKQCQGLMDQSLNELCSLSGSLEFPFEDFGICCPTIELLKSNKRGKDAPKNFFPKKELDICEVLKIGVKVSLPTKAQAGYHRRLLRGLLNSKTPIVFWFGSYSRNEYMICL